MNFVERQVIADEIVKFYVRTNRAETVRHFMAQGMKRRTIYDIIQRYERTGTSKYSVRSVATLKVTNQVKKMLLNANMSVRKVAKKLKISDSTVQNIKVRTGIKIRKCPTVPKYKRN